MTSLPTKARRPTLAAIRLAALAAGGPLRQGLPGDGTPRSAKEASLRCPHKLIVTTLFGPDARHRFATMRYVESLSAHVCFGGWQL